jgi:hypothetical protein
MNALRIAADIMQDAAREGLSVSEHLVAEKARVDAHYEELCRQENTKRVIAFALEHLPCQ